MLANRMTDDSSDSNESSNNQSSEPHVVVACPSCKTKFAVESSLVASYEVPKFHCSRCDLVFQFNRPSQQKDHMHSDAKESPRWVLSDNTHAHTSNPFSQPQPESTTLKSSDFTLGEYPTRQPQAIESHSTPLEERAGLSLLGLRSSAGQSISSAITRRETLSRASQTPSSTTVNRQTTEPPNESGELDPFSLFDSPTAQPQNHVGALSPSTAPEVQHPARSVSSEKPLVTKTQATPDRNTANSTAHVPESDSETPMQSVSSLARAQLIASHALSKLSERNRSLVSMSAPILFLVGFCCVISYASAFAPKTSDSVLRSIAPSLITGKVALLPPAELLVQGVTIDFEKTQSKETIPVVRGVVPNSGTFSVEDVLIEALAFNAQGELVSRSRAPLWSALDREKISDIPLSTVEKYQTSLRAPNSTIRAGERVSFTVALLANSAGQEPISFFSARIFSVGKSRR